MANKISEELFNKAFKAGSKEIARLYTDDAQAFPPGGNIVEGRGAIERMWSSLQKEWANVRLEQSEVLECGEYACESGAWTGTHENQAVRGKYLTLWKNEGGTWKVHRDMWNRDDE